MGKKKKTENAPLNDDIISVAQTKHLPFKIKLKCKNHKQKEYVRLIEHADVEIVFATGSAGTGKSYIALAKALEMLSENIYDKIIYIVPTCEAGSKRLSIGHLPGDFISKTEPYMVMIKENCEKILKASGSYNEKKVVQELFESNKIEFKIMNFVRGSTFDNAFIIIDEAENFDSQEMLLLLTRIGENSKMCIMGDLEQCDRELNNKSGLKHALDKLSTIDSIKSITFDKEDIVRNDLIMKILNKW